MAFAQECKQKADALLSMHVEQKGALNSLADLTVSRERFCFPRELRLTKPVQFKRVFSNPLKSSDRYLTVLFKPNELAIARLGLAIPKRNIKQANGRNRIKRLIRENFRILQREVSGFDVVVLARTPAKDCCSANLSKSILNHFKKIVAKHEALNHSSD